MPLSILWACGDGALVIRYPLIVMTGIIPGAAFVLIVCIIVANVGVLLEDLLFVLLSEELL